MINTNFKTYNSNQNSFMKLTAHEKNQLNKMEENFISKVSDEVGFDPNDPYAGLSEEDAEKLKEMRQEYTNDIRQKKQQGYDSEFEKSSNEHNKEIAKIKSKCDKISRIISTGKNYSKADARYLGKNDPSSLSSALMQRSLNEMFKKKDDEKPKKVTGKDDKNFDDLEAPQHQIASGDLTESEKKGLPTAQDLPNFDTQKIPTSAVGSSKAISIDIRM